MGVLGSVKNMGKRLVRLPKYLRYSRASEDRYLELYVKDTNRRVRADPTTASGGVDGEPGILKFVHASGLEPHHMLLDFGCGTLRAGSHLISYLDADRYVGVDISTDAIAYSREHVQADESLRAKNPLLLAVEPFEPLALPSTPDFVLCNSVFTHLPPKTFARTLVQIAAAINASTLVLFTVFLRDPSPRSSDRDPARQTAHVNYHYAHDEVVRIAAQAGLACEVVTESLDDKQVVFSASLA